ncbi:hypothetical protein GALMADRAFT_773633 [Galerina marginata CBS 339.88]|uniref:CENP-V/GFA domain-containing protein n=1 Tax=Galerina marginata (strain CBS 339.88) TaxID=685588 RepID=A0A067SWH4_GALM3|nr:hypothetical protein GALMADRAFT_773633 [Galerina marginata CBS 339.88]
MAQEYDGNCYCGSVRWKIVLKDTSEARTSLCHCGNCKKFFSTDYGVTTKVPWSAYSLQPGADEPTTHVSDNNGSKLTRQFCGKCGSGIREWGEAAEGNFTYVCYGGLDDKGRKALPPKAEFFVSQREPWCQEILGNDVFRKD